MTRKLFVLTVSCLASPALTSSECDLFEESTLCISHLSNLIDRQPVEDEAACQNLCQQSHAECKNFTFVENKYPLKSGEPNLQCYLWKRCIKQVPCSLMDCTSSVSGPSSPNISNSCSSKFKTGVCTSPPIRSLPPSLEEKECQEHCRADKGCLFYSLSPTACSLHSTCPPRRRPCPGCRSGPKRPRLNKAQIQA